jgi:hypothetical protein
MNKYDGRRDRPRCSHCGVYVSYKADNYTPFGCADPENPEPYDPSYMCAKHAQENYLDCLARFKSGSRYGNWNKSNGEMRAANECTLIWIGSEGIGMLGTENFVSGYRYVEQTEYDRLKQFPYWGYCKTCGAERKGGYCGDDTCPMSFKSKTAK